MFVLTLCIVLALVLAVSYYCYESCFYYPVQKRSGPEDPILGQQHQAFYPKVLEMTRTMAAIPCEEIRISANDGTQLFGRYYAVQSQAPIMLLMHGYQSCVFRDCSGGFEMARSMGFNALAVDHRAHGESSGRTITFGVQERKDCLCWIAYLNRRFGSQNPIILNGLSMGAATVLMAADLPLPPNVACVIADSPYSSPAAIIRKVCKDRKIPSQLAMPFIRLGARIYGKFNLQESSAVSAVTGTKLPILLIHGMDDRFVPCRMSEEIAENCAACTLELFPGAGHGLSFLVDPIRYKRIVLRFLMGIPTVGAWIDRNYQECILKE